jgi:hypothetical protein
MKKDKPETEKNVEPVVRGDGFDDADDNVAARLIQGTFIKCVDGNWSDRDGVKPPDRPLLALDTLTVIQHWKDGQSIDEDTIVKQQGKPFPDVGELNKKIPVKEWEEGINGPRPPWQQQLVVYLLDEETAGKFTFASGTVGAGIAVSALKDAVYWKRQLNGVKCYAVVALQNRPFKTRFGQKLRPHFNIVGWRSFDEAPPVKQLEPPPQGPAPVEQQQQEDPKPAKKKKGAGLKTVADPTLAEQLGDSIRF